MNKEHVTKRLRAAVLTSAMFLVCPGDDIALVAGAAAQASTHGESGEVPHNAVFPRQMEFRIPNSKRKMDRIKEPKAIRPQAFR